MKLRAKRLLALAMAGVMALSMAGCGGSGDSGKETTGQTGESKCSFQHIIFLSLNREAVDTGRLYYHGSYGYQ